MLPYLSVMAGQLNGISLDAHVVPEAPWGVQGRPRSC